VIHEKCVDPEPNPDLLCLYRDLPEKEEEEEETFDEIKWENEKREKLKENSISLIQLPSYEDAINSANSTSGSYFHYRYSGVTVMIQSRNVWYCPIVLIFNFP